jgi:hypothetical protein
MGIPMKVWMARSWCRIAHRGGMVTRDPEGRINWQCSTCGRWSDLPVPLHEERRVVDRELAKPLAAQKEG